MIRKQQTKREQTYPVCLHAVEKYERLESINKKWLIMKGMIKKQQVKNEQIKRKQTCPVCFVKVLNSKKTSSRLLKSISTK